MFFLCFLLHDLIYTGRSGRGGGGTHKSVELPSLRPAGAITTSKFPAAVHDSRFGRFVPSRTRHAVMPPTRARAVHLTEKKRLLKTGERKARRCGRREGISLVHLCAVVKNLFRAFLVLPVQRTTPAVRHVPRQDRRAAAATAFHKP